MKQDYFNSRSLLEEKRIDDYLKGRMMEDEELRFLDELKREPALRKKAIIMARLVKGLKQVGRARDEKTKQAFRSVSYEDVEEAAMRNILPLWQGARLEIADYNFMCHREIKMNQDFRIPKDKENLESLFQKIKDGRSIKTAIRKLTSCWKLALSEPYGKYAGKIFQIGQHLAIGHIKNNDKDSAMRVLQQLLPITEENSEERQEVLELIKNVEEM